MSGDGRPEVTVVNPAAPRAGPDVLGEEEPTSSRQLLAVLLVALLVVGTLVGVGNVRDRRAAAALERQLASAVELSAETGELSASGGGSDDDAELEIVLGVRNNGPRPVTLVRSELGYLISDRSSELAPGGVSRVALRLEVSCLQEPPLLEQRRVEPLMATVRTADGVERSVDLGPVNNPFPAESARRLCGYLPLGEAVGVSFPTAERRDGALDLTVALFNSGRFPVSVDDVRAAGGMSVEVVDGDLPVTLPSGRDGQGRDVVLRVRMTVDDCVQASRLVNRPILRLQLSDGSGASTELEVLPDQADMYLYRACSSG